MKHMNLIKNKGTALRYQMPEGCFILLYGFLFQFCNHFAGLNLLTFGNVNSFYNTC